MKELIDLGFLWALFWLGVFCISVSFWLLNDALTAKKKRLWP